MDVTVSPSNVAGQAQAPPSKSYTHRAILAAGYADNTIVENPLWSADTKATARAVEAFGGDIKKEESKLYIDGFDGSPDVPEDVINCENSGTTIRLTAACASLANGITVLTGDQSLRSRPQGPLLSAIRQLGGAAESTRNNGQAPLVIEGPIEGGDVAIPGDVSSQFITALLMAGPVTDSGINITLETELKSAPYVDITREVLEVFDISTNETDEGYAVAGEQEYTPTDGTYNVPGDFSSTSYLLAAGALAAPEGLTVNNAVPSAQGDTAIVDILANMGAELRWDKDAGQIDIRRSDLKGVTVSVEDTPDLLPTIAVLGAVADGTTRITNCKHVRYKETDRVSAMATALSKLGAEVTEHEAELVIDGDETSLQGATVDGQADHRVIMSLTLAGLVAEGDTTVRNADHVDVSYPGFFDTMKQLGAAIRD